MSGKNEKSYKELFGYPVRVESVKRLGAVSKGFVEIILLPDNINKSNPVRVLLKDMPEPPDIHIDEELRISVQKFD